MVPSHHCKAQFGCSAHGHFHLSLLPWGARLCAHEEPELEPSRNTGPFWIQFRYSNMYLDIQTCMHAYLKISSKGGMKLQASLEKRLEEKNSETSLLLSHKWHFVDTERSCYRGQSEGSSWTLWPWHGSSLSHVEEGHRPGG